MRRLRGASVVRGRAREPFVVVLILLNPGRVDQLHETKGIVLWLGDNKILCGNGSELGVSRDESGGVLGDDREGLDGLAEEGVARPFLERLRNDENRQQKQVDTTYLNLELGSDWLRVINDVDPRSVDARPSIGLDLGLQLGFGLGFQLGLYLGIIRIGAIALVEERREGAGRLHQDGGRRSDGILVDGRVGPRGKLQGRLERARSR